MERDRSSALFDDVQLSTAMVRVADLDTTIERYSEKLAIEPVHRGADGNTPPYAAYVIPAMIVTMWQLGDGDRRHAEDNDRNSYLTVVYGGDIDELQCASRSHRRARRSHARECQQPVLLVLRPR